MAWTRTAHSRAESRGGEPQSLGLRVGYGGSGPAQLALALLLDFTDDEEVALAQYTEFKNEVVSQLDCTGRDGRWRLTGSAIDAALREMSDEAVALST